ncbi:CinA family nicotinamide mononucleotide deamidase-related protein [Wenyingzhuangia aestuarii]|uniref:CinA family nicotinamide mononucleotide deamidase-related protein n=1 Tax=Wenyingzhuangia aestuarii TaxID=1647582 RepID=UPI00143A84B0|nr:CinA family nicotinamide mononucleotide deamidase-related protein [Wenyingzhuangia aestuarii]NJB82994.1 nicotinamide-nucleotide amidase [Wenyingzhuangia aestuarii]
MKASIITIGDEILIGQVLDTNTQWIANKLHALGVELVETVSISDTKQAIVSGIDHAVSVADLIIVTGGLGPTKDDITKYTLTEYFGDELVLNKTVLAQVQAMFKKRGIPFGELNKAQAMLPKEATILPNPIGTAAGMWFQKKEKIVISLPGVPFEMKGLVENEVLPRLTKIGGFPSQAYQTYVLYGVGESTAAEMLEEFENQIPEFIKLAYLPAPGRLRLRLTGVHSNKSILEKILLEEGAKIAEVFKGYSFMVGDVDYINFIKDALIANKQTLAVAESCTGGKIAHEITIQSGVSAFFLGGVVAYNVALKQNLLGVAAEVIQKYSVVSAEVAKQMVLGIQRVTGATYAISTTGNAGPTSDDTKEDVGIVFIAIATENQVIVEKFNFGQPREKVIEQAKNKAFEMLSKEILKNH